MWAGFSPPVPFGDVLRFVEQRLERASLHFGHGTDNARDEAYALVIGALGLPLDTSYGHCPTMVGETELPAIARLLTRRIEKRVPLAYLLGRWRFADFEWEVDPRALVPRSPLAELTQSQFRPWFSNPPGRLLDLGCGSGVIGLSAALHCPGLQVDLVDVDAGALALAQRNLRRYRLESRCRLFLADVFDGLDSEVRYDLIVSNPPYVGQASYERLPAEYRAEPRVGLAAGPDGLSIVRRIVDGAAEFLNDRGLLMVEVGESAASLEQAYPELDFLWLDFERGGDGVFMVERAQLNATERA